MKVNFKEHIISHIVNINFTRLKINFTLSTNNSAYTKNILIAKRGNMCGRELFIYANDVAEGPAEMRWSMRVNICDIYVH